MKKPELDYEWQQGFGVGFVAGMVGALMLVGLALALTGCKLDQPPSRSELPNTSTANRPELPDSSAVANKVAAAMQANDITLPQVAAYLHAYGFDVISRTEFKRWTWTPPTSGSPVAYYVVNFRIATGNAALPIYIPSGAYAAPYVIRVVGVDSQGRVGPWSESNQSAPGDLLPGVAE